MLYFIPVDSYKGGACSHADNYQPVDVRGMARPESVGYELIRLAGGKSVKRAVHKRTAHTGQHHLLHIGQMDSVIIDILAERSEQGSYRVGRRYEHRRLYLAFIESYDFSSASTYVYTYYNSHSLKILAQR